MMLSSSAAARHPGSAAAAVRRAPQRPPSVCRCRCLPPHEQQQQSASSAAAEPVSSVVEEQQQQQDATLDPPTPRGAAAAAAVAAAGGAGDSQEPVFKAVLAIILQLSGQDEQQQPAQEQQQQPGSKLEAFVAAQPLATSIPFISWLADMEASADGGVKAQLGALCGLLLALREARDAAGQEALYADSLRLLSGGDGGALALLQEEPRAYALALAEGMTGQPVVLQGYGPAYDALLQVAPSAALTPAAVAQGHALAEELGSDLSARRKSTLAAMLGRVKLDSLAPEAQAALLGPRPAARILDLLLSLEGSEDRLALLPDCFTPPAAAAAAGDGEEQPPAAADDGDTDELWCTPMQLLNEIDGRLSALTAASAAGGGESGSSSSSTQAALPGSGGGSVDALQELRLHISSQWLASLPRGIAAPVADDDG